ncbi:major facilitator superfamily domain-containing protein [Fimicolochytrium jonesii]|uniref:major facilitator superfamily domain-containing protein n=1 Tax=Fimicolochytrium jonesii TaxID=1396493 RepID=UPI0022FDF61A|nr:major facilitator superfamily domain-containing protein [Fimicolochytrium jonesii]KAI8820788.1 major facilitator superfamily domain-containing protein [Fimicolochytrium jonesii]
MRDDENLSPSRQSDGGASGGRASPYASWPGSATSSGTYYDTGGTVPSVQQSQTSPGVSPKRSGSSLGFLRSFFIFNPPSNLPLKQTAVTLSTVLPEIMIHHMLTPLYPYMTRALLPAEKASKVGYYAGLLQSAFAFPSTFMDAVWGQLSDSFGRATILLAGLVGYGVGTMLLGLSMSYWLSVMSLATMGFFSSNSVVAKGMIGEIATDDSSRAWAYSAYGVVFSFAGILGTLAGGFLGDPALFAGTQFLHDRPYFVACSIGAFLAGVGVLVTFRYLKRSIQRAPYTALHPATANTDFNTSIEDAVPLESIGLSRSSQTRDRPRLGLAWRLTPRILRPYLSIISVTTIAPIVLATTYKLSHSLFHTALPLLASSPIETGGFGLPPKSTSFAMTLVSVAKLLLKASYFPIHGKVGTTWSYAIGCALIIPGALIPPLFGHVALWPSIYMSSVLIGAGEGLCYLASIMLLTDAVSPAHYGLIHGLAGCAGSVMKTVGPTISGAVWELGVEWGCRWLIFGVVAGVAALGGVLSRKLDVRKWECGGDERDD